MGDESWGFDKRKLFCFLGERSLAKRLDSYSRKKPKNHDPDIRSALFNRAFVRAIRKAPLARPGQLLVPGNRAYLHFLPDVYPALKLVPFEISPIPMETVER